MSTNLVPYNMYEAQNAYQRLRSNLSASTAAAIAEIKTFLKMFPDVALAHNDLGVLYHKENELLQALAHYEKANRLQPNTPTIIKNLAEFYCVVLGWTDDAIDILTSLLNAYPDDFELLTALGEISSQVGQPEEARAFFRKALQLDPGNQELREKLAQLDGPVSAAEYRTIPSSVPQYHALPTQQQQPAAVDEYSDAAATFERMLSLNPSNALAHNNLGIICLKRGDIEQALSHYEQAVRFEPDNPTFSKNLADLFYTHLGRTDDAIEIYTGLLKKHPKDVELLTALAIISQSNQLKDQARTFIRSVLELEPWNTEAREFLAGL